MARAVTLLVAVVVAAPPWAAASPSPLTVVGPAGQGAATALYRAPATYREPGRPARNSVIITSQPVRMGHTLDGQPADGPAPGPAPATWRRQLFVRTTLGTDGAAWMPSVHVSTSSTALGVGGVGGGDDADTRTGASATPVVAIDCADGKSCSTTIPVRPPAATHSPTFKPYSQEVLDKFLSDYATVTTAGNGSESVGGKELLLQLQQQRQQQQAQQAAAGETPSGLAAAGDSEAEPTNRLANLYLDEGESADNSTDDKSKSVQWSLLKSQHHKHPYDDHKGWVTLEPVPWSSSHVSKWQSNARPGRPWDSSPSASSASGQWHNDIEQRPQGHVGHVGHVQGLGLGTGPHNGPNSGYHHGTTTHNFNGNGNGWPSSSGGGGGGPSRPPWSDTPAGPAPWDRDRDRPGQGGSDYRPGRPSSPASWESSGSGGGGRPEQWVSSTDPDIITDNSPPDFPAHPVHSGHPGHQGGPRPGGPGGGNYAYGSSGGRPWGGDHPHREPSRHPSTHPEEGDGTWVLLSSTKGYSTPPRGRLPHQRALTVSTHRSVRLTVLPPENGTNMTTAHGGLLEVEDTQHTVDESQRLHAASLLKHALDQHHNATLSSYESLVREAARVHEAQLLKQALADRQLANATALSPEFLHLQQQQLLQQQQQADKRSDNVTAPAAVAAAAAMGAAAAATSTSSRPARTKTSKSRTKVKVEPQRALGPASAASPATVAADPNFTGRGEGSAMAVKVMRPATPSRRSMALAAVGAGLLPATMAMLVPIMLGRRRRSAAVAADARTDALVEPAAAPTPAFKAFPPDQPLEAEDSPPRVIDFAHLATAAAAGAAPSAAGWPGWPRPRRRRQAREARQARRGTGHALFVNTRYMGRRSQV